MQMLCMQINVTSKLKREKRNTSFGDVTRTLPGFTQDLGSAIAD